jgi:transposase
VTAVDTQRKQLSRELVADLRRLDAALGRNSDDIAAVSASGTSITQIHGIGPVLAAKIIGHSGAVERFPSRHHYASYCGTA